MVIPDSKVGQGIDFLLEQRNRRMKNYVIRNGVPTGEQWKAASASMQSLDKVSFLMILFYNNSGVTVNESRNFR